MVSTLSVLDFHPNCDLQIINITNRLHLNPSKTKYIWLGTRQQLANLDLAAMAVRLPHIAFSLTVRDLGLTLDQQLTFAPHINRPSAPAASATCHLSLSHFHCYCYSCPRFCHISD